MPRLVFFRFCPAESLTDHLDEEIRRLQEEVAWLKVENAEVMILKQENEAFKEQIKVIRLA